MNIDTTEKNVEKTAGRVYTPKYIVQNILGLSGYYGEKILQKHVIDNSCGDGAFLTEIVSRYCTEAKNNGISSLKIAQQLSEYIHGIELDLNETEKCKKNLDKTTAEFGINNVNWDINNADTLSISKYDGKWIMS